MRRKDKEVTDLNFIHEVLEKAENVTIAMIDGDEPYIVTMNYFFSSKENAIYLHSAREGRKIEILMKKNRVAFTVDTDAYIAIHEDAYNCTTHYKSVFGTGKAVLVDDLDKKIKALNSLMEKHTGKGDYSFPEEMVKRTLIIRIDIDYLSGKKSGY